MEYLIFRIDKSFFGIAVQSIIEIFALPELIQIEEVSSSIAGFVNVRGNLIPVMDMYKNFNKKRETFKISDHVIIVDHPKQKFGIIVDETTDVYEIGSEELQDPPLKNENIFSEKIAILPNRIVSIINISKISIPELSVNKTFSPNETKVLSLEASEVFQQRSLALREQERHNDEEYSISLAIISLGGEYFAIDASIVQEFCEVEKITPVPCCPPHICGDINLRGDILTLIDIGNCLGISLHRNFVVNKIVVVQTSSCVIGIVIEDILDILYLDAKDILPLPSTIKKSDVYVEGSVKYQDQMCTFINLDRILQRPEWFVDETV